MPKKILPGSYRASLNRRLALGGAFVLGFAGLQACGGADDPLVPVQGTTLSRVETDTGVRWVLEMDAATNTVRWAFPEDPTAQILKPGDDTFSTAAAFLARYPETFGVKSPGDLENLETSVEDGITHVRFGQKVAGAPADFARLDIHFDAQGGVSHVSGPFYPTLAQVAAQVPTVAAAVAEQTAVQGATAFGAPGIKTTAPATLRVALDDAGAPRLEWLVHLVDAAGIPSEAHVDAMTGAYAGLIVLRETIAASGDGVNGARVSFEIDPPVAGKYVMTRAKSGNRPYIHVYQEDASGTRTDLESTDNNTWEVGADPNGKGSGVDAMSKLQRTEAWYREKFGYVSYDNVGGPIEVRVYIPSDSPNAFYAGGRGAGSDRSFGVYASTGGEKPPTETDTMGHEFTHAVTAHNGNLVYGGQSGALNESMSDVFGQLIEMDIHPSGDPSLVSEEFGHAVRSMKDPKKYPPSADHMDDATNVTARLPQYRGYDNGGVHILSGIPNLAWYLMTFGGPHPRGTRIPSSTLGATRSRAVYWDLMRHELKSYSSFKDAAKATLLIARYKGYPREAIGCAWNAVGVLGADELRKNYKIDCGGDADAGEDLCRGRGTAAFCHPTLPKTAVLCVNGTYLGIDVCQGDDAGVAQTCTGADYTVPDAGEGQPTVTARCSAAPQDSCAGKADGYYCSQIPSYEFAAYYCQAGSHLEGQFCPSVDQRCTGFAQNDAGQDVIQCESKDGGSRDAAAP